MSSRKQLLSILCTLVVVVAKLAVCNVVLEYPGLPRYATHCESSLGTILDFKTHCAFQDRPCVIENKSSFAFSFKIFSPLPSKTVRMDIILFEEAYRTSYMKPELLCGKHVKCPLSTTQPNLVTWEQRVSDKQSRGNVKLRLVLKDMDVVGYRDKYYDAVEGKHKNRTEPAIIACMEARFLLKSAPLPPPSATSTTKKHF